MNDERIFTRIWAEKAEVDNPFAAAACYCCGYDVYGDMLGKASWIEYLYLLFKGAKPDKISVKYLEGIAFALANPGPRDYSVRAAMNAGAGGSTAASALMAALSVGAGQYGGAREVYLAMENWQDCGCDLQAWQQRIQNPPIDERIDIWPDSEHFPGFDPYGTACTFPIRRTLEYLSNLKPEGSLSWLVKNQSDLEAMVKKPLAMTGLAATAFYDLKFTPQQSEMLFLFLRLPGAAAHALEQYMQWDSYPFFKENLVLTNDSKDKP